MKKVLICILGLVFLTGKDLSDLLNFTAQISIRNLYSGDMITLRTDRFSWKIQDVYLPQGVEDLFATKFGLTPVQFVDTVRGRVCLAFSEGHLRTKTCYEDIVNKQYETVFTIIPTTTTAVQLRLFVNGGKQCLVYSDNPKLPFRRPFDLAPCNLTKGTKIDLQQLFVILPPYVPSKVTNP